MLNLIEKIPNCRISWKITKNSLDTFFRSHLICKINKQKVPRSEAATRVNSGNLPKSLFIWQKNITKTQLTQNPIPHAVPNSTLKVPTCTSTKNRWLCKKVGTNWKIWKLYRMLKNIFDWSDLPIFIFYKLILI